MLNCCSWYIAPGAVGLSVAGVLTHHFHKEVFQRRRRMRDGGVRDAHLSEELSDLVKLVLRHAGCADLRDVTNLEQLAHALGLLLHLAAEQNRDAVTYILHVREQVAA